MMDYPVYYNEIDRNCCNVLRRHIDDGQLYRGYVDERDIRLVQIKELEDYKQLHFFSGIGAFPRAFKRAGIPTSASIFTGGFPCQDLSVAGKRKGLAGSRSGLYFAFQRLIAEYRPEWVVIENVPGILSSNAGRDFAIVIGGLTGIVPEVLGEGWGSAGFFRGIYSVAYRVLDAQFYGVAQRRRRVFIVASLGNGRAAEVLFESEGLRRNPPPRGKAGKGITEVAGTLSANRGGVERPAGNGNELDFCIVANPIGAHHSRQDLDNDTYIPSLSPALSAEGHDSSEDGRGRHALISIGFNPRRTEAGAMDSLSPTINPGGGGFGAPGVAFQQNTRDEVRMISGDGSIVGALSAEPGAKQQNYIAFGGNNTSGEVDISTALNAHGGTGRNDFESETFIAFSGGNSGGSRGIGLSEDITPPIRSSASGTNQTPTAAGSFGVRRLMPVECERLQGFPDGWTDNQSDSARYKQLGNAIAETVAYWIGKRIEKFYRLV